MKQSQPEITVLIDSKAWTKLRHWVTLAGEDEVSCLGLIDEIKNNGKLEALLVSDIYLVEQIVNSAETMLDDKAVANLMIQLSGDGIDVCRLKCWIHSHSTMKVFWSTTDDECCCLLANGSYSVSVVTNLRGEILTRIDVYNPCHMVADKIPTLIHCPCSKELEELYSTEFQAKVKRQEYLGQFRDRLVPAGNLSDLDLALEQGYINIYEYEQLSGVPIFEDI
jgi:hypothetical protein